MDLEKGELMSDAAEQCQSPHRKNHSFRDRMMVDGQGRVKWGQDG